MYFEDLVKRISPTLKRITYKLKRDRSPFFDGEDLFQEALLHLWNDFQQAKLEGNTDSYILQGCYFHLKNYLRKHKPKADLFSLEEGAANEEGGEPRLADFALCGEPNPVLDEVHLKILLEQINNNGLTEREKQVFNLGLGGATTRQIGRQLGISHVRVVKLQKRIREKCRRHLDIP